jgi:hypothetical protein
MDGVGYFFLKNQHSAREALHKEDEAGRQGQVKVNAAEKYFHEATA